VAALAAAALTLGASQAPCARAEDRDASPGSMPPRPSEAVPALGSEAQAPGVSASFWSRVWDYLYRGASVSVGIGSRQADLQVTDKATGATGRIAERHEKAYFFGYSTRPSFIGTTRFAYNFAFNYTTFDMDQQEVARNDYQDLGTRVHGRFAYLVPTAFYQFGNDGPKGAYTRAGIGLGLGVAKFEGDIILGYPGNRTPVAVSNSHYDLKFASSLYLETRYRNWGLTVRGAGPQYEDDRYKYGVTDLAVYFSYAYYF
jgi:hypothetical protein